MTSNFKVDFLLPIDNFFSASIWRFILDSRFKKQSRGLVTPCYIQHKSHSWKLGLYSGLETIPDFFLYKTLLKDFLEYFIRFWDLYSSFQTNFWCGQIMSFLWIFKVIRHCSKLTRFYGGKQEQRGLFSLMSLRWTTCNSFLQSYWQFCHKSSQNIT